MRTRRVACDDQPVMRRSCEPLIPREPTLSLYPRLYENVSLARLAKLQRCPRVAFQAKASEVAEAPWVVSLEDFFPLMFVRLSVSRRSLAANARR
jgi:hypothetical protein